jgi:hypothetical protein
MMMMMMTTTTITMIKMMVMMADRKLNIIITKTLKPNQKDMCEY